MFYLLRRTNPASKLRQHRRSAYKPSVEALEERRVPTTIALTFDSLPSAQGWTYVNGHNQSSDYADVPENVFSVDGTKLSLNDLGWKQAIPHYELRTGFSNSTPFTIEARVQVLKSEPADGGNNNPYFVAAYINNEAYEITINTDSIGIYSSTSAFATYPIDPATPHDYRLIGIPGQRFEVYVDGVQFASVVPPSYNVGYNALYFGDGTSYGNCSAELTSFTFTQGQPDVAVAAPTWSAGQGVNFSYSIGGADLTAPTTVGLYWSTDSHFDRGQDTLAYSTMSQTAQSQTPYAVSVTHDQIAPPPPGSKYLLAVIDPDNTIHESDAALALQDTITISSPTAGSMIYMTSPDGRTATVPLQVDVGGFVTGNVDWKFDLRYVSPVTQKVFDYSPPISLGVSDCIGKPYGFSVTGMGGKLTLQVSAVVNGTQITSDPVAAEIRGYQQVPTDAILNTLTSLHGSLFVGVADLESKFKTEGKGQFNLDGTPYISNNQEGIPTAAGLTQISLQVWDAYDDFATYWDWQVNANRGAAIFDYSLSKVDAVVLRIRSKPGNENLPALSQVERENWALGLYSNELKLKHERKPRPFYLPNADRTAWIVNPQLPSGAKTYVNAVRNRAFEITEDQSVLDGVIP